MSGDLVPGRHGRPRQPLEEIPQEYAAFKIEQRGIDLIPPYTGPISNHFPGLVGGDFSWAIGIVVGALVYWVLAARSVRQEAAQTSRS